MEARQIPSAFCREYGSFSTVIRRFLITDMEAMKDSDPENYNFTSRKESHLFAAPVFTGSELAGMITLEIPQQEPGKYHAALYPGFLSPPDAERSFTIKRCACNITMLTGSLNLEGFREQQAFSESAPQEYSLWYCDTKILNT